MLGQILDRLTDEVRRIWCYRWLVAAVTATLLTAAAAYAFSRPNTYEAWGQLYVSRQTTLSAAAQSVSLAPDGAGSLYVVQKTMLNDENLEAVARSLSPGRRLSQAELAAWITSLRARIRLSDSDDGFVEVHYTDTDPARAQAVVRAILNQFVSGSYERAQQELQRASTFLDEQIASYAESISQSQARIAALRGRSGVPAPSATATTPAPESAGGGAADLVEVSASPAPPSPRPTPEANERVGQLESKLTALLAVDTEQHPDVVATRRQLEEAKAQRDEEASALAAATPSAPRPARRVHVRRRAPPPPPAVVAELADLQRKDELLRANYQQLVAKRAAAEMSTAVSGADRTGKFQVTRQPARPTVPVGPRRELYLAAGLVLALAGGIGAGYLRAAMRGILVSPRELEEVIQLPVIGTVSWEPAWRTRPRFSAAFDAAQPPPSRRRRLRIGVLMEKAS